MPQQMTLFDIDRDKWVQIDDNISLQKGEHFNYIYINGHVWFKYKAEHYFEERYAIVLLNVNKHCSQPKLGEAFGFHFNTINNWVGRYKRHGLFGLLKISTAPKSRTKVNFKIRNYILSFDYDDPEVNYDYVIKKVKEKFDVEISNTLMSYIVTGKSHNEDKYIQLSFNDYIQQKEQRELSNKNSDPVKETVDTECDDTTQEIVPDNDDNDDNDNDDNGQSAAKIKSMLQKGILSCYGAALILTIFIGNLSLIEIFKNGINGEYIKDYSYNSVKFIKVLIFMVVFEFSSFERFKTVSHKEFGPLIGYHRAPSVRTLRNRLDEVAQMNSCEQIMDDLARQYLKNGLIDIGVLYFDGHSVPYYGCNKTPKKFFTTRNLALKADQHIYVNGKGGRPFFFKFNDASKKFIDLIPEIADHAKKIILEETGYDAPLILIFDREPYSTRLFKTLTEKGYIFISWRKHDKKVSTDKFKEKLSWEVDAKTTLNYCIYRRQITVGRQKYPLDALSFYCEEDENFDPETDKAATLVTNANQFNPDDYADFAGLSDLDLIQLMCGRWKQENFFKIMKNQFFIDHHPDYEFMEISPQPMVKNPVIKENKKEIKKLKRELTDLKKKLADKFTNPRYNDKSLEHYQTLKTSKRLIQRKEDIETEIEHLETEIKKQKEKVPFNQVSDEKMKKRAVRRKLFIDILKTAVFNVKELALITFGKHYDNPKDIRVIFNMLLNSTTYLKLEDNILKVYIQKPERPKYQKAFANFLQELNELNVKDLNGFADRIEFKLDNIVNKRVKME